MLSLMDKAVTGISRVLFFLAREIQVMHTGHQLVGIDFNDSETGYELLGMAELSQRFKPFVELVSCDPNVRDSINEDDILVLLGEQWMFAGLMDKVAALKEKHHCRVVSMIHDFSPYVFPETFEIGFPDRFKACIQSQVTLSDCLVVYSNSTKKDLLKFFPSVNKGCVRHVTLGSVFDNEHDLPLNPVMVDSEYILLVSTLQPRKNHGILLWVWRSLLEKYGACCPSLVLVGKYGYGLEDFLFAVKNSPDLNSKIKILGQISDSQLNGLYEGSLFTIYPSLYEGWGLPVAESLSKGKACLVSQNSSMTEIGEDLVDYINPNDSGQIFRKICEYLDDRPMLAERNKQITDSFKAVSWSVTAKEFIECLEIL